MARSAVTPAGAGQRRDRATEGPPDVESAVVDCGFYLDGRRAEGQRSFAESLEQARKHENGFVWLGLYEPSVDGFAEVARILELHPLAVEDAVHAHQRPKLEQYGDTAFLVVKTARYVEHEQLTDTSEVIETGEIMLFVGPHFVVTVRHGAACRLEGVRKGLERQGELLRHGPWAVAYGVTDHAVDEFLNVVAQVEDDVEEVEGTVFAPRRSTDIQRIYHLKRELMELRRAVIPMSRPLAMLSTEGVETGLVDVPLEMRTYFSDVEDHLARVAEQVNAFDELLSSVLDANLAQIGIQQNDDMRRISAWVAIAAVPTMLAGIYGMNFKHMPELGWYWGYPAVLLVMFTSCGLLYRAFKRSGWL